jgi:uncharacterized protein
MNLKIAVAALALYAVLLSAAPVAAAQPPGENEPTTASDVFVYPIHFFRKFLSGADGDRCSMHPSCSAYSLEAFKRNGPLAGYFMTCDRLLRCGRDEKKTSPPVNVGGSTKTYDPVSNNDFWWKKSPDPR